MKIFLQTLICCLLCGQIYAYNHCFDGVNKTYVDNSNATLSVACPQDSLALVALYNATNGSGWTNTWNLSQPMNTWYGVFTNGSGCVTNLYLIANNLVGTIPAEMGNLSSLTDLQINDNQLSGALPAELGNLSNLTVLIVNNNQLGGCFDSNLAGFCSQLDSYVTSNSAAFIDAGNNFDATWDDFCSTEAGICMSCSVTDSLALIALYNSANGSAWGPKKWILSQPMSTWEGITLNADGCVTVIDLLANDLSGTLPPEIGDLSELTDLLLSYNDIGGNIPPELGNLTNLATLRLDDNIFTGSIPPTLAGLGNLTDLLVDYNQLSGCYDSALQVLCGQLSTSNNASISEGNGFDAEWETFCSTGTCTPLCPISLSLSGNIASGLYQADYNIYSNGTVPTGNDVDYKAGTIITLASGFSVEPNTDFSAEIEGCIILE